MRNLSVRARIAMGFAVVILIMMALTGLTLNRLVHIRSEALDLTTDALPGSWYISRLDAGAHQNYRLLQRFYLAGDEAQRRTLAVEMEAADASISDLLKKYEATIHREQDRQLYTEMEQARTSYLTARERAIADARIAAPAETHVAVRRQLDASFQNYSEKIQALVVFNKQLSDDDAKQILDAVGSAQRLLWIGVAFSVVLATISGWLLVRAINQPLAQVVAAIEPMRRGDLSQRLALARDDEFSALAGGLNLLSDDLTSLIGQVQRASMEVNTSVTEIAATAREQQSTATEIAATTTEIGATSKEISATSRELVKSMNEVAEVAEQTATLATSGQTGLSRMQSTMHGIMEASSSINARLAVLNEKAGNINTVVNTIAKVADQTNLLSLNAAIEAEKAGEYGRGFAVVATEIRRLADQTASAMLDIEQTVKEMQSAVSAGVMGMDKFSEEVRRGVEVAGQVSEQLTQIIDQVQTLTPNFEAVNEGMQSQSMGAEQISDALAQLSEAAQQTVESLRQSNLAIEQMNDTVRGLQNGISRFTLAA